MRFDDRLTTVLAQPASDPHDRAVRWRQLVELVARSGAQADPELVAQAIAEIRNGSALVGEPVRAAAALAVARYALPVALVGCFAADRIGVAAPVLASARLTASEWAEVAETASDECRGFIAGLRPHQASSSPPGDNWPAAGPDAGDNRRTSPAVPSISEVVARIERLRRQRESHESEAAPAGQEEEPPRLFRWECNESGEIEWVEGAPRGAFVGQSIAQRGLGAGVDPGVERAFAARTPFHDRLLELPEDSKAGGSWKISGVPAFERASGRFAGYRGIAARSADLGENGGGDPLDPDSLRELAHEIKTPLNAIIGFAEIITGEYLGPVGNRYRERAADIVAQARLLLSAVEDLDFAARLRASDAAAETELSDALAQSWEEIEEVADKRGVRVFVSGGEEHARCLLDSQLAARLVGRLCLAVVGAAAFGETLTFRIGSEPGYCVLTVNCPASLKERDLSPERNRRAGDIVTLPLRLVTGLARTAGGELLATNDELSLRLLKP